MDDNQDQEQDLDEDPEKEKEEEEEEEEEEEKRRQREAQLKEGEESQWFISDRSRQNSYLVEAASRANPDGKKDIKMQNLINREPLGSP